MHFSHTRGTSSKLENLLYGFHIGLAVIVKRIFMIVSLWIISLLFVPLHILIVILSL